jgi:4-hydroxybenzoate polyprenyltransferase
MAIWRQIRHLILTMKSSNVLILLVAVLAVVGISGSQVVGPASNLLIMAFVAYSMLVGANAIDRGANRTRRKQNQR